MERELLKIKQILIEKINKSIWWHVIPQDPHAYKKRGKFLASTYLMAEFYGRPSDNPEKVFIKNPVFGFSELEIWDQLIPDYTNDKKMMDLANEVGGAYWYKKRIDVDATMFKAAKKLGYDAIILVCQSGYQSLLKKRKPHSIELNLINI